MGLELEYIDGQTPIDEDEKEGLLIETIAIKGEHKRMYGNVWAWAGEFRKTDKR